MEQNIAIIETLKKVSEHRMTTTEKYSTEHQTKLQSKFEIIGKRIEPVRYNLGNLFPKGTKQKYITDLVRLSEIPSFVFN